MSVLIKGIGMPTGNDELRLIIRSNGQVIISHKTYFDETEAILVPPHGRLIDADVLVKSIKDQIELIKQFRNDDLDMIAQMIEVGYVQEIANAPTILEAEVEE